MLPVHQGTAVPARRPGVRHRATASAVAVLQGRHALRLLAGAAVTALVAGAAVLVAPQVASAATAFPVNGLYATVSGSSTIYAVDRTTGSATAALTAPGNATGLNQIGVSGDGTKLFLTNGTNVYEYSTTSEAWRTVARSTGASVATQMGGVDPKSGRFFFGGLVSGTQFSFTSYTPSTDTTAGSVAKTSVTVDALGAPGTNGDLAFDRLGNLYFISSSATAAQLFRVDASALSGGTTKAVAVGPAISPAAALTSLAFGDDGYLYITGSTANTFLQVNPVTGKTVAQRSVMQGTTALNVTDLGSRAAPSTGQAEGGFTDGRAKPGDQLTTTVGGGDITTPASATTADGTDTVVAGPVVLLPGQSYTVSQTPGNAATNPNDYDTSYVCTNLVDDTKVSSGKGTTAPFTVPAAGGDVKCTFANPLKPVVADTSSTGNTPGQSATVDVLRGAVGDIDPTTVKLTSQSVPNGTLAADGKTLTVPGQGVWTVDARSGALTFSPEAGFTKNPTPVTYTVQDTRGNQTQGQAAVTYLGSAQPDSGTTTQGAPVTIDVLANDQGGTVASSVVFPSAGQPAGAVVSDAGRTLTVDGEGVYSVDPASGAVTFTPAPAFRGATSPVTYRVADADGSTSTASISVSVAAVGPRAAADSATTGQNTPVSIAVIGNDRPGVDGGTPIDPTSVVFPSAGQPVGAVVADGGTTLTVDGEGVYTIDPKTGAVRFVPVQGFTGPASVVSYQVADTGGTTATSTLSVTVTAVAPTAAADTASVLQGGSVSVDVLGNDAGGNTATPLDPTSVVFPSAGQPAGAVVSDGGKTLTVAGEGVYVIDPKTGAVRFTPEPAFRGAAAPVTYQVADVDGTTATSTVSVSVTPVAPRAADDGATTQQNTPVDVDVLGNDRAGVDGGTPIDRTSVLFPAAGQPSGAAVSDGGATLTVPGRGVYTVDSATGVVTFAPAQGFTGTASPVTYQVADTGTTTSSAQTSTATITVTVTAVSPTAKDDTATTDQGAPVTIDVLDNDRAGNATTPVDPTTVVFPSADQPAGAVVSDGGKTLTVPGEGVYTIGLESGAVTFTPISAFRGSTAPVTYRVADVDGSTSTAAISVAVAAVAPRTGADSATTDQGTPVSIDVLGNDQPGVDGGTDLDPTSVVFPSAGQPAGAVVSDSGTTLTVAGAGVYTVDPKTGAVTFTPDPAFRGAAAPVTYQVADVDGTTSTSTVSVSVVPVAPRAADDRATTQQNTPVDVDVLGNDRAGVDGGTPIDPTTVAFPAAGQPVGAVVSNAGTTLTVPGQGTYTADSATGVVTFAPAQGFTGTTSPVTYQVADTGAQASPAQTSTATITVTVTAVAPGAKDDTARTARDTAVTMTVLGNDTAGNVATPIDAQRVRLLDPSGTAVAELAVPGKGVFMVDVTTGTITFTPTTGYSGTVAVPYRIVDVDGGTSDAVLTVVVGTPPAAVQDSRTGTANTAVTIDVLGNDGPGSTAVDPASVRLVDPRSGALVTTVTIADEGTYTVNRDGSVTFTPVTDFAGRSTVRYSVAGLDGSRSVAAITVTIPAVPGIAANPAAGGGVVVTGPTGTQLAFTGTEVAVPASILALLLLGAGAAILVALRRRRRLTD